MASLGGSSSGSCTANIAKPDSAWVALPHFGPSNLALVVNIITHLPNEISYSGHESDENDSTEGSRRLLLPWWQKGKPAWCIILAAAIIWWFGWLDWQVRYFLLCAASEGLLDNNSVFGIAAHLEQFTQLSGSWIFLSCWAATLTSNST